MDIGKIMNTTLKVGGFVAKTAFDIFMEAGNLAAKKVLEHSNDPEKIEAARRDIENYKNYKNRTRK